MENVATIDEQPRTAPAEREAPAWLAAAKRAAGEPLAHFLFAGACILIVSMWLKPATGQQRRIDVTAAQIQQLTETYASQWGRAPSAAELQGVIDDFVREEVLYREAVASGLDRNDTIVRRRLAQKVEFLAQGVATAEPGDAELRAFFDEHHDRYRIPDKIAFEHVYFTSERETSGEDRARTTLVRLEAGEVPAGGVDSLGDKFMLQRDYPLQTRDELKNLFGSAFADRAFQLPLKAWTGPVRSSYGLHLVRVAEIAPSRLPEFQEVRDQVAIEYKAQHAQTVIDLYYRRLRDRYDVYVDGAAQGAPD